MLKLLEKKGKFAVCSLDKEMPQKETSIRRRNPTHCFTELGFVHYLCDERGPFMKTNLKLWSAKRMLCLALCILMLVGIAMPSLDAFTLDGRGSLLGRLFGVTKALAAPADGATIDESGTYGTCSYDIYSDGTMVIRPTNGTTGTWGPNDYSPPWYENSAITSVEFRGTIRPTTCDSLFHGLYSLESIDFTGFDTSNVTDMDYMFSSCEALTSLDVSNFDTSNVTDMSHMFEWCYALTSVDVSGWNTSNVVDMNSMFYECESLTSLDVSRWDTNKVVDMSKMFCSCYGLTNLDVSGWDTSNVTDMTAMFAGCGSLTSLDVSRWDTSNVTSQYDDAMDFGLFSGCSSLASLDASGWDTSKMTNMSTMFRGCSLLTSLDVSGFDISNVTDMHEMFFDCSSLTSLDVSGFDTSSVTNMHEMFSGCSSLTTLDVSGFDTSNVTSMSGMFSDCSSLTTLDVSGFDTSNVTSMRGMFSDCSSLTSLDVSGFDTSKVEYMHQMFRNCYNLTNLDVSNFDTSNVMYMSSMFRDCSLLTSLDVSGFDTSNVTDMHEMFSNCSSLTSLDPSGFNTSKVTSMERMFSNCSSLTSLDASGFDTSKVTNMNSMFSSCKALTNLDIGGFDTSNVTNMGGMFSGCSNLNKIELGEDFAFNGKSISNQWNKALLPTPPSATTTGKWVLEDDVDGGSAMTPEQMRDAGLVPAGTWVWQEKPTKYTVIYHYNDGTGSTNTEKYVAAEAATLSSTYPARFNKIVTSWNTAEDGTGTSYELGATIPANTYAIGDVIDLYAIWEDNTSFTNVSEGVYQFQIPGNAQIKLDGLPAGTVYRVSEMLPNGWILVNQSNSSGSIGPLTNSVSTFINKYMPESASAAIYATKTMDGAPATEDMAFEFTLKEGDNVIQTVTAANGAVLFDPIIYTSAGTHVYTIVENWETYSGPLDASGVTFDTHAETVTVEVTDEGEGKLSAEVTYDADGPAFANRTNPGDLIITKNVIGQTAANANDTFTFTIRIKSPTGGDINSASVEIGKLPTAEQSPEPTP